MTLSVVPSLDTLTWDKQTHILSEENKGLDKIANLITISRNLLFAQKRFVSKTKMQNITFLPDYRDAEFGKSTGLLIKKIVCSHVPLLFSTLKESSGIWKLFQNYQNFLT